MSRIFADREDAGRQLAAKLARFKQEHPVVLAIPRGGVPVGFEISKALEAELDIILVRKIGAPYQPELAVGAVVDGERPETVWNREIVETLELSEEFLKEETARALKEIERRRKAYIGTRARPTIGGRTAIVVDDGIATGATVRAALIAIRRSAPKRLVLAIPVAPPETVESLRKEVEELVCLETPDVFLGISQFYVDFPQLTDPQVTRLLGGGLQRTEESKAGSAP
jgi:putative phosphoribosyl transferase